MGFFLNFEARKNLLNTVMEWDVKWGGAEHLLGGGWKRER